jgi:ComF family protein
VCSQGSLDAGADGRSVRSPLALPGVATTDGAAATLLQYPTGSPRLVCRSCWSALTAIRAPLCACCGAPTAWPVSRCAECSGRRLAFVSARAAVTYSGPARQLVRAWKERGLRPFAALAADLVVAVVPRPAADVITHIPPDGDRSLKRGHQPATELARELAVRWQLEPAALVARARPVVQQAGLSRIERRRNVRGAFVASSSAGARTRTVVLIDDVYTTGATAAAAASALRAAGVREVYVVTFARTVR